MTKQLVKTTAFALFLSLFLTSCQSCKDDDVQPEPEPTTAELLVGEWDIDSFDIQGFEFMGSAFSEFTLEFGPIIGERGLVGGSLTFANSGEVNVLEGEYRLDEFIEQIVHIDPGLLPNSLGLNIPFDIFLQGKDQLIIIGTVDFENDLTIRATRISN